MDDTLLPQSELDRISAGLPPSPDPVELPPGATGPEEQIGDRAAPPMESPTTAPVAAPIEQAPPTLAPPGTVTTKGSRTVEGTVPSAELKQGQADEQKVFADQKKLAIDEGATSEERARVEQQRAEQIADETARQNAAIQAEQQYQADQQKQRNDKYLTDLDEIKHSQSPKGFEDWSGKRKAFSFLSVALGGYLRGHQGGANTALEQVNKSVHDEFKRHAADMETKFKVLEKEHGFNQELEGQARDSLARLQARKVVSLDTLNKYADAQLKALGVPVAQQAAIKAQLGFDAQAAEAKEAYGKIVSTKVTDTGKFRPTHGAGAGGGTNPLSKLHEFARAHLGPEQESQVVAEAERLFPGQKPAQLQTLVAGAVKASADAKERAGAKVPGGYTDVLTGQTLPVDETLTDTRKHNEAVAKLKPINTFIGTAHKLLDAADSPSAPEWTNRIGVDTTGQSSASAAITRLRSAYAAAKGESVGTDNAAHLATAIPDPPSWPTSAAHWKAWRTKIQDVVEEMSDLRKEGLANAGVPLDVIKTHGPGRPVKGATTAEGEPSFLSKKPAHRLPNGKMMREVSPGDWEEVQ